MTTPRLGRQSREILARLLNGDRLTSRDAALEMSVWRLAARVKDLRLAGWNVVSERVSDGERTFAAYHVPLGCPRIVDRQQSLFDEESA